MLERDVRKSLDYGTILSIVERYEKDERTWCRWEATGRVFVKHQNVLEEATLNERANEELHSSWHTISIIAFRNNLRGWADG